MNDGQQASTDDNYTDAEFEKELELAKRDPALVARVGEGGRQRLRKIVRILEHYDHAREKHPYFCDRLLYISDVKEISEVYVKYELERTRKAIEVGKEINDLALDHILQCEILEAQEAITRNDNAAAVEECYDCIAVLLRVVDVLEGRQPLGRPEVKP